VVALWACAFGYKVAKSRNVIGIIVDVKNNFKAEIREAQTILNASKNL
jgi:uncharacterized protein involved in propanediol utilization